ncbi:MAG: DUF4961 domain-containing protein [Bacteroidota bacterium]
MYNLQKITLRITFFMATLFSSCSMVAQVITVAPTYPADNDSVTLIFDAAQGNAALLNATPPIYAHTGVITNLSTSSSDWRYVIAGWSENTTKAQLTTLGNNKYRFKIKPSVRSFYNVPDSEAIVKMAFVFRNSDGSKVGRNADGTDIFADVYPAVTSINIVLPVNKELYLKQNSVIVISAISPLADSLKLFVHGTLVKINAGKSITDTIFADNFGQDWIKRWVRILAKNDTASAADSFSYTILPSSTVADLPPGMEDGINYIDSTTALLCLYAPNKSTVNVIGDFNNWQVDSNYYPKITPDGKRYWLQINNLIPKQEYIFQYLVNGALRIGDPYADKVSDYNDRYIPATTYPGLRPYPETQTTEIAAYLQTSQDPYPWNPAPFTPPAVTDLVVYELLIRDFLAAHDYPTLIDTLDYLKRLGINAIELMPIMEFEGNISWGYNVNYSFAVDKYYGTKNGLKQFVEAAHAKGIAVILDIVCNHHFGTSPLVKLYWDQENQRPAANNPWFNTIPKHPYNVGFDFNHESPDTRTYMERLIRYWITEYHVDGYRFDMSKGFTQKNSFPNDVGLWGQYDASRISILNRYSSVLHTLKPNAYMILEHFADNSEETILTSNNMLIWGKMNPQYIQGAGGWNTGNNSDFSWGSYKNRGWSQPNLVTYMESHDEERVMYKNITAGNSTKPPYNVRDTTTGLKRIELNANLFFTIPGPKMIWQFGELGYDYSINYAGDRVNPKPIRWDYLNDWRRRYTKNIFTALIGLKKTQPVFSTTNFTMDVVGAVKRIWLKHATMDATVLGNFDVVTQNVTPGFTKTGMWYEFYTGDSLNVADVSATLAFKPGEYRLYTTSRLPKPVFTGVDELPISGSDHEGNVFVYPNPALDLVNFKFTISQRTSVEITIYDVFGRMVKQAFAGELPPGIHQYTMYLNSVKGDHVSPGIYIYVLQSGKIHTQGKIIVQ